MIENTRKSVEMGTIKESRKSYYLLFIDHKPVGICTQIVIARACAEFYAEKYGAKEIGEDVYVYEDCSGQHLIFIESVKRIRMPYHLDED